MSKSGKSSMNNKRAISARRSRTRTRKPKFLSLRLQFPPKPEPESPPPCVVPDPTPVVKIEEESSVAYDLFSAAESDGATTTITALLGAPSTSASSGEGPMRFSYGCRGAALARAALRSKQRDPSEEKWVCYSEVTSCAAPAAPAADQRRLSLKLDYQGIINAWSDKGPLYVQSESPQTVPDIFNDDFLSNGGAWSGQEGNMTSLYAVPEMTGNKWGNPLEKAGEGGDEAALVVAGHVQRAASVLRYKEKRRNRLFSKTIRYQVRKLNAEKRPRVKGRFVRRD